VLFLRGKTACGKGSGCNFAFPLFIEVLTKLFQLTFSMQNGIVFM